MTWPGFFALPAAWLFLLLVPLVIFYFLKLKRPRLEIPSLALWRSVLQDRRVNSPFQKFRRNLLLLLQILLLVCLVLAAMQPFWPSGAERAEYLPILIDCSASMAALDGPSGRSRLDAAKEEVARLIDRMLPDQRLSLIAVSSTARRLTDFTDNKRVLHEALAGIEVHHVPSRLEEALRLTQAMARTQPVQTVLLFTDGNVPEQVDFALPFQLSFQKLAPAGPNIGITAINARRGRERWDIFVRIEGSSEARTQATVEMLQDGRPAGDELISLDPGQSQRIVFSVDSPTASALEVRLKPEGFDALESDNVAWLDLPAVRPLAVYCPREFTAARRALAGLNTPGAEPRVLLYPEEGDSRATPASYDLVISDRAADAQLDAPSALLVGFVPEELSGLVSVMEGEPAEVVDWQRSADLLQHVLMTDVQIAERPVSREGVRDRDFEELGYEILAQGRAGPLILRKETAGRPVHHILFHTDRSTLPYRVAFPILISNAVQIALTRAGLAEARGHSTGSLAVRGLAPETGHVIVAPDESELETKTTPEGALAGVPAPDVGRYSVREGSREVASVGVSLLAVAESTLATVDQLQFRETSVGAATDMLKTDRPLWPMLAGLGFALLFVEWWYFQRPPSGLAA